MELLFSLLKFLYLKIYSETIGMKFDTPGYLFPLFSSLGLHHKYSPWLLSPKKFIKGVPQKKIFHDKVNPKDFHCFAVIGLTVIL